MIRKTTNTIALTIILTLTTLSAFAQSNSHKGGLTVNPVRLEQLGDSLYLELDVVMKGVQVKSPMTVELAPVLAAGTYENKLPRLTVAGRRWYKACVRSIAMNKDAAGMDPRVVKGYRKVNGTVRYSHVMPYRPWMQNAVLGMQQTDSGCGQDNIVGISRLFDSVSMEYIPPVDEGPMITQLAFVKPEPEAVKTRELQVECRLDFPVNKTDINPAYMNNPHELARIRNIIDELEYDPFISVTSLEIVGYASPEGSLAGNRRLSEGRAIALRDYLASLYNFPMTAYKIRFGGENWNGLVKALESSSLSYSSDILTIIDNTEPDQTRKNKIASLRGGTPYREMLKTIYPGLRTALCNIDYNIRGFDEQEAADVFKTRPQNLSLNEFYMVSTTMQEGSQEFIDVFETAVRMYPDDEVANLNAAIAALKYGNIEAAERYMSKVTTKSFTPEYNNTAGVIAVMKEDYQAARTYFNQAAPWLDAAKQNIEMLDSRNK